MLHYKSILKICLLFNLAALVGCSSAKLPKVHYKQYSYDTIYTLDDFGLSVLLKNPLECPLRIWVQSSDVILNAELSAMNPITIPALTDTTFILPKDTDIKKLSYASRLGSTTQPIINKPMELPYKFGKKYKVIQGNHGNYTHNSDWSAYAIDFNLKERDTVCAAINGFVIGIVDAYKHSGKGKEWKPYANFITIYNKETGIFTQYVHLAYKGSLVQQGDYVVAGQPIALSGNTGQTTEPHLHFNCLIPEHSENGLKSVPFIFKPNKASEDIKEGIFLSK